jgi:serine/threonine protein kinase
MTEASQSNPAAPTSGRLKEPIVLNEDFVLVEKIGRGGMGAVYRAEQRSTKEEVAIKVLNADADRVHQERFVQEARALARVKHPRVVRILHLDRSEKHGPFMVMELLRGRTVQDDLDAHRRFSTDRALPIIKQVGEALHAIHQAQIIHRDIKPANVMLLQKKGKGDSVKLLDFGVAKLLDGQNNIITEAGVVVGTLYSMAPEQVQGEALDARTDVYGLGAFAYEIITGRPLFTANAAVDLVDEILQRKPRHISRRRMDGELSKAAADAIMKCVKKSPDQRFQSIESFLAALDGDSQRGVTDAFENPASTEAGLEHTFATEDFIPTDRVKLSDIEKRDPLSAISTKTELPGPKDGGGDLSVSEQETFLLDQPEFSEELPLGTSGVFTDKPMNTGAFMETGETAVDVPEPAPKVHNLGAVQKENSTASSSEKSDVKGLGLIDLDDSDAMSSETVIEKTDPALQSRHLYFSDAELARIREKRRGVGGTQKVQRSPWWWVALISVLAASAAAYVLFEGLLPQ